MRNIVLFFLFLVLLGCELKPYTPGVKDGTDPEPSPIPAITKQFVLLENETYQFQTNDDNYKKATYLKTGSFTETEMTSVTVEVSKVSGKPNRGYGVVFCAENDDNFLALLINTERTYDVVKKETGKDFAEIVKWTFSGDLNGYYNTSNKIEVDYLGSNQFKIYFNGTEVGTFTNETAPFFTGGRYGYIATVGSDESFPETPVDVRFKQGNPASIGL